MLILNLHRHGSHCTGPCLTSAKFGTKTGIDWRWVSLKWFRVLESMAKLSGNHSRPCCYHPGTSEGTSFHTCKRFVILTSMNWTYHRFRTCNGYVAFLIRPALPSVACACNVEWYWDMKMVLNDQWISRVKREFVRLGLKRPWPLWVVYSRSQRCSRAEQNVARDRELLGLLQEIRIGQPWKSVFFGHFSLSLSATITVATILAPYSFRQFLDRLPS